jgi:hypothetical protein
MTPDAHAAWNGRPPLCSGTAVQRAEIGTLSIAVRLPSGTYFATARHVIGGASNETEQVKVFREGNQWSLTNDLMRPTAADEPGAAQILASLDVAFLEANVDAHNLTPDAASASTSIGTLTAGDEVWLRGCRHDHWIRTTYLRDFAPDDEAHFNSGLAREHAGIIDLTPLGTADAQPGNSGTAVWLRVGDVWCAVGHLVAVSELAPLVLVVRYRSAFAALGLDPVVVTTTAQAAPAPPRAVPA